MEKWEFFYTVVGNVNWGRQCRKEYGSFSEKLKIRLSHDPVIPLLGICLKKKKRNTSLKRYRHSNFHSHIIYSCQDMETTYMSISRCWDKEMCCINTQMNTAKVIKKVEILPLAKARLDGKPFNITVIQVYAPSSNVEETS